MYNVMAINSEDNLIEFINLLDPKPEAIIVEGYDGVGKGRVLNVLSKTLSAIPYRPDYNLWQKYDHRAVDRWKVSGFFWEIYNHFCTNSNSKIEFPIMLFDRGVISGAVYNHDYNIAADYRKLIKGRNILHVLVTCSREDYNKFSIIRGSVESDSYEKCLEYTGEFLKCLEIAEASYVIYHNHYSSVISAMTENTCEGCGHFSFGWCRHPVLNCKADPNSLRCDLSVEREVQDIDPEMQRM